MRYRFHPDAEVELNDAVDYYDECQEGFGLEFAKEVYAAIESIWSSHSLGLLFLRIPGDVF